MRLGDCKHIDHVRLLTGASLYYGEDNERQQREAQEENVLALRSILPCFVFASAIGVLFMIPPSYALFTRFWCSRAVRTVTWVWCRGCQNF